MNYYNMFIDAYFARARGRTNVWVRRIWDRLKSVKSALGFWGDLLVLVLAWWLVENYVPYGDVLTTAVTYLFGAMVVFSVLYIVFIRFVS